MSHVVRAIWNRYAFVRIASVFVLFAVVLQIGLAAISLSTSTPSTQNFDVMGIPASATTASTLPADFRVDTPAAVRTVGTFAAAGTTVARAGAANLSTSAANGSYSFGSGTTTLGGSDRAVGFLSSGTATSSGNLYAQFVNNTGATLTGLQVSYNVEKYRGGSNAAGFRIQLFTSPDGSVWASAGNNFLTSFAADATNNGFATAPGATVPVSNQTLPVTIANGGSFFLAWNYSVSSGSTTTNAQALAIDDISILGIANTPTNPSATGAANPSSVQAGSSTLLTVAVTPGLNPASTGIAVTADLSSIGGSSTQQFFDDGTHGDVTAGDNTFSFLAAVPVANSTGGKSLPVSVTDAQARTASTAIALTVTPNSTPPSGTGAANPNSLQAGANTLLTVAVTAGANPVSTGIGVTGNLSLIGGSSTQQFFDDGTHGDVTSGDNIFSFQATVAGGTTPGAKSLPATITDAQARTANVAIALTVQSPPAPTTVKISQVYAGGGNSGATYTNDFIELFNQSAFPVDITGWSVQSTSSTGTTWNVTNLCATNSTCVLQPGHYYLVQEAAGAGGTTLLPTADISGVTNMGAGSGKVALVNSTTALSGACPTGGSIGDFVGYGGSGTNCSETTPAGTASNTAGVLRKGNGCIDTDNNSNDFVVIGPLPRNSGAPANVCGGNPGQPSGVGTASPSSVDPGGITLLTVKVTPATTPASTGISVIGDLTSAGGSASQQFYDDGTHGDAAAGDNIFSFRATMPAAAATGVRYFPVTITDAQGRTVPGPITITIQSPTCGVERWSVKVGTDADAGLVNLSNPMRTTVAAMRALLTPVTIPLNNRIAPTETSVFVINGTMTFYKLEDDVDYHIVLQDADGNTMVTEIPSPACDGTTSPFDAAVAAVRAKFDAKLTANSVFQTANLPVQMTGVGFFDFIHGQTGVAPNGVELHPILDISFTTPTTTTLQSSLNPSQFGQAVSIAVIVSNGGISTPTGTVTLLDGGSAISSALLDANGQTSFLLSTLAVGTHTLTASYEGDSTSATSVSAALPEVVNKADQTITFAPLGGKTYGDADFAVSATASSSLAVSFSASGTCTVAGNTVSITGAGSCTVTASQAGNANYNAALPVARTFAIAKAAQAMVTVSAASDATFGQTGLVATAGGGSGSGAYSFSAGSSTACTVDASSGAITIVSGTGTCSITASRAGDANYNDSAASVPATITVHKASTTLTATSSKNPSTYGDAVSFTATLSSTQASGTVQFQIGGNNFGGPAAVVNGVATSGSTSSLAAGSQNVTATYSGDDKYAGSSGAVLQVVNQAATAAAVVSSVNPSTFGQSVTFTATVTSNGGVPTGTVTFQDGATTIGTGSLAAGHAAFSTSALLAGGHSITAVYGGDNNFTGSASAALSQSVRQANTAVALVTSVNPAASGQAVAFSAVVTAVAPGAGVPTGSVTFKDGAAVLATVAVNGSGAAGFTTSALALGTHPITAIYSGDANFTTGTSAVLSELIFANAVPGGSFVIGDLDAVVGHKVTFWSSQWDKANHLSGGSAPSSFNGFANSVGAAGWTSDPANSAAPPATLPSYMAAIAASTITKSESTITGNTQMIVIVQTDSGYAPNGGHAGTGTVVAIIPQ